MIRSFLHHKRSLSFFSQHQIRRYSNDVKNVAVIGAGQMGTGIAVVTALNARLPVKIMDADKDSLQKSSAFVDKLLKKNVEKKKITEEESVLARERLSFVNSLEALKDSSFTIEAIVENLEVKSEVFKTISKLTDPQAIIATNTSSIPITSLANVTNRPDKVIGMHFFNPVPVMKLVEIIRGDHTSEDTYQRTITLAKQMGKETAHCMKDSPGFIANRVLMPYINEAIIALQEGIATPEDIDKTMVLGCNVPMGPLRLADFIGLDTCLAILNVLYRGLKDVKYKPCDLLEKMVKEGRLGNKSGQGFYDYSSK